MAKEFSTGSLGWNFSGKMDVVIGSTECWFAIAPCECRNSGMGDSLSFCLLSAASRDTTELVRGNYLRTLHSIIMAWFSKQPPTIEFAYGFDGCIRVSNWAWDGDSLKGDISLIGKPAGYPEPPQYTTTGYRTLVCRCEDASGTKLGSINGSFTINGQIKNLMVGATGKVFLMLRSKNIDASAVKNVVVHLGSG